MPWNPDPVFTHLSMEAVFALLVYGEARAEDIEGRVAVAQVVRNRVLTTTHAKGLMVPTQQTWLSVMLKPWAFSCFDDQGGPANYDAVVELAEQFANETPPKSLSLDEIAWIVQGTILNVLRDPTKGATHYYATTIDPPYWSKDKQPTYVNGVHLFYQLDDPRFD